MLTSLKDFNDVRRFIHKRMNDNSPKKNGIACPDCGKELVDSAPMITLASNPPQKNTRCESCDYTGYRIA